MDQRVIACFFQVVNCFVAYYRPTSHIDPKDVWFFEESIAREGIFQKFTSDMCFKIQFPSDPHHQALSAFTHYVYEESNHQRLVADLQGAGSYITDPLVLDVKSVPLTLKLGSF